MTSQQAKIDTAAEETLMRLYRLTGNPTRVRSMTRSEAQGLTAVRDDGRKWVLDPAATMDEITDAPVSELQGKTFSADLAKSVREQTIGYQKEAHAKETAMKTAATTGSRTAKRLPGHDDDDNEYRGLSMCQVIRFAGHRGATPAQAKVICERAGFVPARGTITIQLGKGRKGDKIPNVSDELAKELLTGVLPPAGGKIKRVKLDETAEEAATRKAAKADRKAAKRAKAHKTAGHEVK